MNMSRNLRLCIAAAALPLLAACSETSVMDAFNAGKSSPDENLVATNPPLSMPPDMALRQPGSAAVAPANQAPPNAPYQDSQSNTGNGLQVEQGQRAIGAYQAPPPPQPAQPAPQLQQQQAYQQPAQQPANSQDELYHQHGINPYNADGTRKKQSQLNEEMRQKRIEKKRAENPNYGTVFNMGELWSGN